MKAVKKGAPPTVKGQSSLFSFFKKKPTPNEVMLPEEKGNTLTQPTKDNDNSLQTVLTPPQEQELEKKHAAFVVEVDDKSLYVGRKVRVYWPNEKQWYSGKVESYDKDENTHNIIYEDGDEEDLCLDKEKVCYCHICQLLIGISRVDPLIE